MSASVTGTLAISAPAAPIPDSVPERNGRPARAVVAGILRLRRCGGRVDERGARAHRQKRPDKPVCVCFDAHNLHGPGGGRFLRTATTCGTRLAAGATCTMSVAFRPGIGGVRSATLAINTNAFGSPHTIPCHRPRTAPLTVAPASLDSVRQRRAGVASPARHHSQQPGGGCANRLRIRGQRRLRAAGRRNDLRRDARSRRDLRRGLTMTPTAGVDGVAHPSLPRPRNRRTSSLAGYGTNAVTASVGWLTFPTQALNTTSPPQQVVPDQPPDVPPARIRRNRWRFRRRQRVWSIDSPAEHLRRLGDVHSARRWQSLRERHVRQPGRSEPAGLAVGRRGRV